MTVPNKYVIHNTDTQTNVYNSQQRTFSVSPSFGGQPTSTFLKCVFCFATSISSETICILLSNNFLLDENQEDAFDQQHILG